MYFWFLLNKDDQELTSRVLNAQILKTEKYDWYELVLSDRKELNIDLSEKQIKCMLKGKFKQYLQSKIENKLRREFEEKRKSHTKARYLGLFNSKPQKYLLSKNLKRQEIQILINLRTYMLSDAKINFKHSFGQNIWCTACKLFPESQEHLFSCVVIRKELKDEINFEEVEYDDINGSLEKQERIAKVFSRIVEIKQNVSHSNNTSSLNDEEDQSTEDLD